MTLCERFFDGRPFLKPVAENIDEVGIF